MVDALESVQMVAGDGQLVAASATQNPELFWALRGAGANFGIVVEATFRLYNITNNGQPMVANLVFPAPANQSFYRTLQTFGDDLPTQLALTAVAVYERAIDQVSVCQRRAHVTCPEHLLFVLIFKNYTN